MKKLTIQEWSLIARYLDQGATPTDMLQINSLMDDCPELKKELMNTGRSISTSKEQSRGQTNGFDTERALQKLHERLKNENLIVD
jgi:hypothetical protein